MVERAMLVGISQSDGNGTLNGASNGLLEELGELVSTLGIEVRCRKKVMIRQPQAKFLVGSGKANALIKEASHNGCDVIVFDNELSPAQQRNWENASGNRLLVIDRQEVILDIFARRAHTKEAVLQVELARLEYNLPRLKRAWSHLNRQRGGGAVQRDAGETQLELDQRMVRDRIARTKKELQHVIRHRQVQRKKRMDVPVPSCAIVGYTNAGKSSLLNTLADVHIPAEDKLFATLDPTSRRCPLPGGQPLIMTDTVGFVRNLPHRLVEAFKATLEETLVADFLIHVLDITSPEIEAQAQTSRQVLDELGAGDKPIITVCNKSDKLHDEATRREIALQFPEAIFISAHSGEGIPELFEKIENALEKDYLRQRLLIPHTRYDLVARIHREGGVHKEEPREDGTYLVGAIPHRLQTVVAPFLLAKHETA